MVMMEGTEIGFDSEISEAAKGQFYELLEVIKFRDPAIDKRAIEELFSDWFTQYALRTNSDDRIKLVDRAVIELVSLKNIDRKSEGDYELLIRTIEDLRPEEE